MQTAGIVVLCLFGGALFVLLVGGLATLIVLHVRLKRAMSEISTEFRHAVEKMETASVKLSADVEASIAGARTSFSGIRADMKTILTEHGNQVADTLARHDKAFQEKLGKINGAALEAACVRAVQAANQIVQVASFLRTMISEGAEPATASNLAPEEYGPSETIYSTQSRIAATDEAVFELEDAEAMSGAASAE